jgi:hypothetical protein
MHVPRIGMLIFAVLHQFTEFLDGYTLSFLHIIYSTFDSPDLIPKLTSSSEVPGCV